MNKRQNEIMKESLKDERKVLQELRKSYEKARQDCQEKIRYLESRKDLENIQSIIYQKNYQLALQEQLDSIIDGLNANQYQSIHDYLEKSYDLGYYGTLYDLQGQGIPLIFPVNQEEMIQAIELDSKISRGMYRKLGIDADELKKSIRAEVSRGVANGKTFFDIAEEIGGINSPFKIGFNKAVRIARTEGHRVREESAYHCQKRAKQNGADVVKVWDSSMDSKTRKTHVECDGQVREIDEPFDVGGCKMMYCGDPSGKASEVINCRCTTIQIARWLFKDDEMDWSKWDKDNGGFTKVTPKNYTDFRKEVDDIIKKKNDGLVSLGSNVERDLFPKGKQGKIDKENVIQFLKDAPENARKLWNHYSEEFNVLDNKDRGCYFSPSRNGVRIPKTRIHDGQGYQKDYQVVFHEFGHNLDNLLNRDFGDKNFRKNTFSNYYKNGIFPKTLKEESEKAIDNFGKEYFKTPIGQTLKESIDEDVQKRIESSLKRKLINPDEVDEMREHLTKSESRKRLESAFCEDMKKNHSLIARTDISDMFEPHMTTSYPFGVGHGHGYWLNGNISTEGFAEMYSAMINNPESWELIGKYFPESQKIFLEMIGVIE